MMEKSHNPVDFDFKKLPKAAQIFFDGIKSDLQRISHVADEHPDEPESQIITETKSRYLPDTLKAFYKLPVSARSNIALHGDKNGEQILTEQLQKIAWATRTATDSLIKRTGSDLIVNGRFLNEKFPQSVLQKPYDIVTKPDNIIEEDIEKTSVIVADQENFSVGKNMKLMIFATVFTLFYFLIILSYVERSTKHALVSADKLFLTDIEIGRAHV